MGLLTRRRSFTCSENLLATCCVLLVLSQISLQQQARSAMNSTGTPDEQQVVSSAFAGNSNSLSEQLARFKRQPGSSSRERTRSKLAHDDDDDNLSNFENADNENDNDSNEENSDQPSSSRLRREWLARPIRAQMSASASAVAAVVPARGGPSSAQHVATSVESLMGTEKEDSPKEPEELPERSSGLSDKMKKEGWVRYHPIRREEETSKFDSLQPADPDVGFEQQEQEKTPESAVPKAPVAHRPYLSSDRLPSRPRPKPKIKPWQRQNGGDANDDSAEMLQRQEHQQEEPSAVERPRPKLRKVYADKSTRRPVVAKQQRYRQGVGEEDLDGDCDDAVDNGSGGYNEFMRLAAVPMRQFRRMLNKAFDSMEASTNLAAAGDDGDAYERENQDGDHYGGRGSSAIAASASVVNSGGGGRGYSREESLVSNNGRTRGIISETRNGRTQTRRIGERDDNNNSDVD